MHCSGHDSCEEKKDIQKYELKMWEMEINDENETSRSHAWTSIVPDDDR